MIRLIRIGLFLIFFSFSSFIHAKEELVACGGSFKSFLEKFSALALERGISPKTIKKSVSNSRYLPEIIELDSNQSAFKLGFIDFSKKVINDFRILEGKKNILKYRDIFSEIEVVYGIPAEVLTAFWAMESDFGSFQGKYHTLSALATLAHNCRRTEFFQAEYLASMWLVEDGTINAKSSTGAWAGEIGQIQMLPSDILKYGVDANSNGIISLKQEESDALMTAAALIADNGWIRGEPWLEEVILPYNFPWEATGFTRERSIQSWIEMGVKSLNNKTFLTNNNNLGILLLPQGRKGPKFLAYTNFKIFLGWNDSFIYSVSAAHLANRLRGLPDFRIGTSDAILSQKKMKKLQSFLKSIGYDVGSVDGILGARTRQAVRQIQLLLGFPADSWPTEKLLLTLGI